MRLLNTLLLALVLPLVLLGLAACSPKSDAPFNNTDLSGVMPDLSIDMTRADDGKKVSAADYRGKVTMLYFGYTYCPDVCPLTLANVSEILGKLGDRRKDTRFLFVTVDPDRDTPDVLRQYADAFAPEVDGLTGTPDALAALAKRYRVSYSVTKPAGDTPYTVTHSSAIYVFDRKGAVRLLVSSLSTDKPDIDGTVSDLERLIAE